MSVLLIVGFKCTLAASHAPSRESRRVPTGQTDGRTDGRQTVKLRFLLDAASVKIEIRIGERDLITYALKSLILCHPVR